MVISSWISSMIRGEWQMRKMKIIIMKTTASESSFFLLMSFFFCLFWVELGPPLFRVAGDTLAEGVSTKDSSLSTSGISSSLFSLWRVRCQNDTHGTGWLLPAVVAVGYLSSFSKQCCFLAFFMEQLVFFKDRVECPSKNVTLVVSQRIHKMWPTITYACTMYIHIEWVVSTT